MRSRGAGLGRFGMAGMARHGAVVCERFGVARFSLAGMDRLGVIRIGGQWFVRAG